jgi:hypothetical protein
VKGARGLDWRPIDPDEIPARLTRSRVSKYAVTLAEFVRSGAAAVELDIETLSGTHSVAHSLRRQLRAMQLEGRVAVVNRQGRVFLVRTAA